MLIPPDTYPGWKVKTIGDDIAWLHMDDTGRFWAINPEAGYFGVVPGTNQDTNQNAYETLKRDAIYTNVGVTDNNEPWWEGKLEGNPIKDWKGDDYVSNSNQDCAHPNSRFTVSAKNNPGYSELAGFAFRCAHLRYCLWWQKKVSWHLWFMKPKIGITVF